jgi:hypothetical protein
VLIINHGADKLGSVERETAGIDSKQSPVYLRVTVTKSGNDAWCRFSPSFDNQISTPIGEPFKGSDDRWIGAKTGGRHRRINRKKLITPISTGFTWNPPSDKNEICLCSHTSVFLFHTYSSR